MKLILEEKRGKERIMKGKKGEEKKARDKIGI